MGLILAQILAMVSAITLPITSIVVLNAIGGIIAVPAVTVRAVSGSQVSLSMVVVIKSVAFGLIIERIARFLFYGPPRPGESKDELWMGEVELVEEWLNGRDQQERRENEGEVLESNTPSEKLEEEKCQK